MRKILFFVITFLWVFAAAGQKAEINSMFYDMPVGPVHFVLFEYRNEVFDQKSLSQFESTLTEKCSAKNVKVSFAEIGTDTDDSLRQTADFVCRISNVDFRPPVREEMTVPITVGAGLRAKKKFSFLGFTNIYSGTPDWKCNCNSGETSKLDAAGCLFGLLVADGIIQ